MTTPVKSSPWWIRNLRPLRLREMAFWKLYAMRPHLDAEYFEAAPLWFTDGAVMKLKPTDIGHREIAFLGYVERDLSLRFKEIAAKGIGLLVDVGANYGYFTILWATQNRANRVVSFEASPRNLDALRWNVSLNKLESQVTVIPKAASSAAGELQFDMGPEEQTGWGGFTNEGTKNSTSVEVVTLDEVFANRDEVITILKIDVEGADTWVLEGCRNLLARKQIENIFFEQNPGRMAALQIPSTQATVFLEKHGYQIRIFGDTYHAYLPH